jgi:hypothetical protein
VISEEQDAAEAALRAKARSLLDAATQSWNINPHTYANIRLVFGAAVAYGEEHQLEGLAVRYWTAEQREGALGQLRRLYRSARGDGEGDS